MLIHNSDERIEILNIIANQVSGVSEKLMTSVDTIERIADDNQGGIEPYFASLVSAIEKIRNAIQDSTNATEDAAAYLRKIVELYQNIVDGDPFS